MEYMLLADGTVKSFPCLSTGTQIVEALKAYNGVSHYWWDGVYENTWRVWHITHQVGARNGGFPVQEEDVPEVIKLARMLE